MCIILNVYYRHTEPSVLSIFEMKWSNHHTRNNVTSMCVYLIHSYGQLFKRISPWRGMETMGRHILSNGIALASATWLRYVFHLRGYRVNVCVAHVYNHLHVMCLTDLLHWEMSNPGDSLYRGACHHEVPCKFRVFVHKLGLSAIFATSSTYSSMHLCTYLA